MSTKLVILDRDGTINYDRDDYVKSAEEWQPIPGAIEAIARLNHSGWHVVVASNQSGLGRGLFDVGTLNQMHEKMNKLLAAEGGRVDAIFYCPHTPEDHCHCRKPLSGLFQQIGERYSQDLKGVPAVGDSLRDLQACVEQGCEPHLVFTGKGEQFRHVELPKHFPENTQTHHDLSAFVDWLLNKEQVNQDAQESSPKATHGLFRGHR